GSPLSFCLGSLARRDHSRIVLRVAASHHSTTPSAPTETIVLPSFWYASASTSLACPRYWPTSLPVATSHRMIFSRPPATSVLPAGEKRAKLGPYCWLFSRVLRALPLESHSFASAPTRPLKKLVVAIILPS